MSTMLMPAQVVSGEGYVEDRDPFLFKRIRTWWTLAAVCLMADGNAFLSTQDKTFYHKSVAQEYASDPILRLLTIAMWVICAGLMFRHITPTLRTILKQKPLLALAAFAVISTLWSPSPLLTLKKSIFLCLTFAFAWFFATYYSLADQKRMLLAAGAILALFSIAWIILLPSYGVATWGEVPGEWKGVFGDKNALGIAMFAFFSILPFSPVPNRRRLLTLTLQATVPVLLILKAHSRECLVIFALFIAIRLMGPKIAGQRREQFPFIVYMAVCCIVGIVLGWNIVLSILGEGAVSSWSGRIREWSPAVPYILHHFWLGYGYGGFWTGEGDSLNVMRVLHEPMHGMDSGYIENMLEFGLVGMSIMFIVVLKSVRDFLTILGSRAVPLMAFWCVSFVVLTWVLAVTDYTFPFYGTAPTFIFVVACCGLTELSPRPGTGNPDV